MDVAITGASGLIGSALVEQLTAGGHRVRRLVRREPAGAGEVSWDPRGGRLDPAALAGVDAVVNLAGEGIAEKRWSEEQKERIRASRVAGTSLLAGTIAGLSPQPAVFVSGSAVGYYGDRDDEVLTETSAPGHDFLAGVVSDWEAAARPAAEAGIRTVLARTGIVLSADGGALAKQLGFFRLGLGGPFGSGKQWMSWISLDDEVGAIVHALTDTSVSGPVNLVAPEPVRNGDFARTLGRVLGRPAVLPIPKFAPSLIYGRELVDALLAVSQRAQPEALDRTGYEFRHRSLEEALRSILGKDRES